MKLFGKIALWMCDVEPGPRKPVSEIDLHDAFDAPGFSYGDDLFRLVADVLQSPSPGPLLGIVAERILLARYRGRLAVGRLPAKRRMLVFFLMARGWLARRSLLIFHGELLC